MKGKEGKETHTHAHTNNKRNLTVRLLVASTRARPAKLLGLAATRVRDEEGAVVGEEDVLDLLLGGLVDELLVEGDDALADGLADRVDLRDVTTTAHAHADVDVREALLAEQQHGLKDLEAQDLGLHQLDGRAVHVDHAAALLAEGNRDRRALAAVALNVRQLIHLSIKKKQQQQKTTKKYKKNKKGKKKWEKEKQKR